MADWGVEQYAVAVVVAALCALGLLSLFALIKIAARKAWDTLKNLSKR